MDRRHFLAAGLAAPAAALLARPSPATDLTTGLPADLTAALRPAQRLYVAGRERVRVYQAWPYLQYGTVIVGADGDFFGRVGAVDLVLRAKPGRNYLVVTPARWACVARSSLLRAANRLAGLPLAEGWDAVHRGRPVPIGGGRRATVVEIDRLTTAHLTARYEGVWLDHPTEFPDRLGAALPPVLDRAGWWGATAYLRPTRYAGPGVHYPARDLLTRGGWLEAAYRTTGFAGNGIAIMDLPEPL